MLTDKQEKVLRYICRSIADTGRQPTIREIGLRFKIRSPNGVVCHLKALEKKGLIKRKPGLTGLIIPKFRDYAF